MDGNNREDIEPLGSLQLHSGQASRDLRPGLEVDIVLKHHQHSGELTRGIVADIMTKSSTHPHGIKVRLESGQVGRVKNII